MDDPLRQYGVLRATALPAPAFQSLVPPSLPPPGLPPSARAAPRESLPPMHPQEPHPGPQWRMEEAGTRTTSGAEAPLAKWTADVFTCTECLAQLKDIAAKPADERYPLPHFVSFLDFGKTPADEDGPLPRLTYLEWLCVAPARAHRQMLLLQARGARNWSGTEDRREDLQPAMRGHVVSYRNPSATALTSLAVPLALEDVAKNLTVRFPSDSGVPRCACKPVSR